MFAANASVFLLMFLLMCLEVFFHKIVLENSDSIFHGKQSQTRSRDMAERVQSTDPHVDISRVNVRQQRAQKRARGVGGEILVRTTPTGLKREVYGSRVDVALLGQLLDHSEDKPTKKRTTSS